MPRSSVLLTPGPVDGDAIARAAGEVWAAGDGLDPDADAFTLQTVDGGAALQVLAAGVPVLTVLRPRMLPTVEEVFRLLPEARDPLPPVSWWTEAYTPWTDEGRIGVAILDAASGARGVAVHQGFGRDIR
ncbi:hypothetical protein GCM10022200_22900 [Microbacterium awajiense]|uniref:GNAT family N-acetyltransferase n=1 Tax=Microbacterium awajiense TaxID=415214 RepID=A0ABP7AS22_9MICO